MQKIFNAAAVLALLLVISEMRYQERFNWVVMEAINKTLEIDKKIIDKINNLKATSVDVKEKSWNVRI